METQTLVTSKYIRAHYKTKYSSSPKTVSNSDIAIILKNDCACWSCGRSIFEMYDFPEIKDNEVYCEDCYRGAFYENCPICEDSYEKPEAPKDEILIISKEAVREYGMEVKPGFYQVLKYPYFRACLVGGFEYLFEENIKLIREVDINSMLYKLYPNSGKNQVSGNSCCYNCMMKYTGQRPIINNYSNKAYGKKRVKFEEKVIKEGE